MRPPRQLLLLLLAVTALSLRAQQNEPVVRFDFTAHSFHSTLRDLEVDVPGKGRQPFFVPNRGFGTVESYQGSVNGALNFYKKGDRGDAGPVLSLPVSQAWQDQIVFLVSNYHKNIPESIRVFPVALKRSELIAGSVFFCNFTQAQLAVKLGDTPVLCPPGEHQMVEHVAKNGALETVLVELKGQEHQFLYRNGLRVRDDEFIFLFVLPDKKAQDNMTIQMIRYPVEQIPRLQAAP